MLNRRQLLRMCGSGAAGMFGCRLLAASGPSAQQRYVIDGNLIPPIDDEHPLPAMIAAQVRSAGLNALKLTVGGSGNQDRQQATEELRLLERSLARDPELFVKVRSIADLNATTAGKRMGVIFSFEAAEMLEGDVANIDRFRALDILIMGLSYNRQTPFASGVLVEHPSGLTALGRAAVDRMNALGVTLDLSHTDELSSRAALAVTTKPALISHAGCAAIHNHPRNKSDALLRTLANQGGVIGIYELSFLAPFPRQPNLDDYFLHLQHALTICGEDHVGIGTDGFITPNDTSPDGLKLVAQENARRRKAGVGAPGEGPPNFVLGLDGPNRYAVIADALKRKGYTARVIDKVMGNNFARVFRETWL